MSKGLAMRARVRILGSSWALAGALVASVPTPAEPAPRPRPASLGRPCLACHSISGCAGTPTCPSLAMPEQRFVREMRAFRDGDRSGSVMNRIARGYRDEDFSAMAGFFSGLRGNAP